MTRIVIMLIRYAIFLGMIGSLVDVTIMLRDQAAKAHHTGLVNLKTLNESLVGK
jgi:hypothetical protein